MKILSLVLLLALVGCAKNGRVLTLEEVSRPTRQMIDADVRIRGFIFFHAEETLLCPKPEYGSAPFIHLSMSPSMRLTPEAGTVFRRGFDGKEVIVGGVLKIGPLGALYVPTLYLEVRDVQKG